MKPIKPAVMFALAAMAAPFVAPIHAAEISLESAPPVVVRTDPVAGATNANPNLTELRVTFSKPMQDGTWSWSTWGEENYPETTGQPRYQPDGRTCVLPVRLEAGRFYATWLNSDRFKGFQDAAGRPAVPYLLSFRTAVEPAPGPAEETPVLSIIPTNALNADQRAVLAWTDRQFRSYYDQRTFDGWTEQEKADLEAKSLDALNGPQTREYYQAINSLGALRSTNALPRLRELAFERRDKNNRDRWMAIRVLGLMGDKASVPELIHLVYHGNINTRWWAQISLVQLTGQNFGSDWDAWGKWWDESGGQPPYIPEVVRWWNGQPATEDLARSLAEGDAKFLEDLRARGR